MSAEGKPVDDQEVLRIARLARLEISEKELEGLVQNFQDILGYFAQLRAVSTEGVEPTYQALPGQRSTPMRSDEVRPSLSADEVLEGAPDSWQGHFRVPKVIEEA